MMDKKVYENFLEDINKIYTEYNAEYSDIKNALDSLTIKERYENIIKESKKNNDLVGKCFKTISKPELFPAMYKYYKVLSSQSYSQYNVECLTFYEHPTYWFDYSVERGNYFSGNFELMSVKTEDCLAKHIRNDGLIVNKFEEISLEEFNNAMRKHFEELISMEWTANHERTCNMLPTDPRWKKVKDKDG